MARRDRDTDEPLDDDIDDVERLDNNDDDADLAGTANTEPTAATASDDSSGGADSGDADDDVDDSDDDADDSDDDADDSDANDDSADDLAQNEAPPPRPAPRRSLGPTLLVLGGGVWAIAAALRCGAPEPGPSLAVTPEAPDAAPAEAVDRALPPPPGEDKATAEPEPAAAKVDQPDEPPPGGPDAEDTPPVELPPPEGWAEDLDPPRKVTYTVRRGGSIKNVANLFKIFHHEIQALNPGIALEQELPPNSKVVVYLAKEGVSSESVDYPSAGGLEGAVPMVEGPGRQLKAIPWKSWGTAHTVTLLDQVLRRWAERGTRVQPILVGNMSSRKGGRLPPHSTHQSGRDVDLGYLQKLPEGEELNWRTMTAQNLDAAETWALLKLLRSTGEVEVIFIDSSIQKLLYDHAVANGTVPKAELAAWMEYPRSPPRRRALIQHVKGHVDHLHVRFDCQPQESRCKSRER